MTSHFFYISDISNSLTLSGKNLRKKSMLENFRANVLKETYGRNYSGMNKIWKLVYYISLDLVIFIIKKLMSYVKLTPQSIFLIYRSSRRL